MSDDVRARRRARGVATDRTSPQSRREPSEFEAAESSTQPFDDAVRALKTAGVKISQERAVIIESFFDQGGHATAEELAARVRERTGRANVSTVYRTLKVLSEHGLASGLHGKGQARFRPEVRRPHLDRLVCTRCRKVVALGENRIDDILTAAARAHGFEIQSRKVEVYGLCPRCRRLRDIEESAAGK